MTEPQTKRKRLMPMPGQLQHRQFSIALESTGLVGLTIVERRKAVIQLSRLLMLAADLSAEESDDDH
jgi:hypothetical protein